MHNKNSVLNVHENAELAQFTILPLRCGLRKYLGLQTWVSIVYNIVCISPKKVKRLYDRLKKLGFSNKMFHNVRLLSRWKVPALGMTKLTKIYTNQPMNVDFLTVLTRNTSFDSLPGR